jgi:hypothetical protein
MRFTPFPTWVLRLPGHFAEKIGAFSQLNRGEAVADLALGTLMFSVLAVGSPQATPSE